MTLTRSLDSLLFVSGWPVMSVVKIFCTNEWSSDSIKENLREKEKKETETNLPVWIRVLFHLSFKIYFTVDLTTVVRVTNILNAFVPQQFSSANYS